jgi:hypothetical protein
MTILTVFKVTSQGTFNGKLIEIEKEIPLEWESTGIVEDDRVQFARESASGNVSYIWAKKSDLESGE